MATAKTTKSTVKKTTAKRPSVTTAKPATAANVVPLGQSEISTQIETLREDLKALAQSVKSQALSKVDGRAETAKAVATEQAELAKVRYDELTTKAETQIREKPLSSMAIAVGAGLVLGALLRN